MEYGTIKPVEITQEMRSAYLDYAMSVIVARALPDVRDGLKPVQRRIIYVMQQLGLQHNAAYKKSARIVGDTLGRYHPHGDQAVYEAMVRMAQDFTMRYPLVDGQGNFGCFTGDTRIRLADGTDHSFVELVQLYGENQAFDVPSMGPDGNVITGLARNPRVTRRRAELIELRLNTGETIRCTPDHRFMLVDGSYKQAQNLTKEDNLMAGEETGDYYVVRKRLLDEKADVYDITVEPYHNFLLSSGVFVHNSVDGDSPAAQRYTEARLTALAEEMLRDIEKETVDFIPNFDGTLQEPTVLPSVPPNLLLNGAAGIAVGMATNIPPHNLNELCAAISLLIDNPDVSVDELMRVMPGPDFPTGGIILGQEGILSAYSTGKGHFVVRAKAHIEEATRGRYNIIVTELPYQVNKARLLERIADLVKQDRLSDISDLRDESDRSGMRVVVTLKREANAQTVLNQLFKYTQMQVTFGVNLLALVDGTQPRVLTLKRMLQHYISYRQEVIIRRTRYDLDKARHRAHILEGLLIALDNLDEVINTIRRSQTAETAKVNLMKRFKLTEIQAQAILDLQLRRLAALERKKIEEEYREVLHRIEELEDLLANPKKILALIKTDMEELSQKYGDTRRTRITSEEAVEIKAEDLIPDIEVLVTLSERGYIKRLPLESYRRQRRSGSARSKEQDALILATISNTMNDLLFFSAAGKAYQLKAHQLPDAERDGRGLPLSNLLSVEAQDQIVGMMPVRDFESGYIVMATRNGKIKRSAMSEFRSARSGGLPGVILEEGDVLVSALLAQGEEDILIVTHKGQAARFVQEELRPMGRSAAGVKAISLEQGDSVVSVELARPEAALLTVAVDGYGKRAVLDEYPVQGRGGKGVASAKSGQVLAAARVVRPEDEVMILSAKGIVTRSKGSELPLKGRATRGDRLVELDNGDQITAIALVPGDARVAPRPGPEEPTPATKAPPKAPEAETKKPVPAARPAAAPKKQAASAAPKKKTTAPKKQAASATPKKKATASKKAAPAPEKKAELATAAAAPKKPAPTAEKKPAAAAAAAPRKVALAPEKKAAGPAPKKPAPAPEKKGATAATKKPAPEKKPAPPATKKPTPEKKGAPPATKKPTPEKKGAPPATKKPTPEKKGAPPVAAPKKATPAPEKRAAARPSSGPKKTEPAPKKVTPPTPKKPAPGKKPAASAATPKRATPPAGKKAAAPAPKKTTPATGKKPAAPVAAPKKTAPATGQKKAEEEDAEAPRFTRRIVLAEPREAPPIEETVDMGEDHPPLIIRRMGRVLAEEEEKSPKKKK